MKVKCVATLLFAAVLTGQAPAQAVDTETVDRLTARAMKHLTTMSRFAYKEGIYGDMEFGKNFGYTTVEGYFGETTGVKRSTVVWFHPKSEDQSGLWVNGDRLVFTKKGDKGGTVIHRDHVAWAKDSDSSDFAAYYAYMGLRYFLLPTSAKKYGRSRNPASLPYREQFDPNATTISEVTHRGRPCIKVVLTRDTRRTAAKPLATEYFLDREHGMVLTQRQKGMPHVPKGSTALGYLDVDQVTEVTYGPPTENGLPFPTAVKGWFVWSKGRREPMTDLTFTEFRRYTPTADELDFEKQFGIPLPALPPKPGVLSSAGGSRVSWWLLSGLALTAVAAAVVYVRHRRTARRHEPAPDGAKG
jgi:hypothetical protein